MFLSPTKNADDDENQYHNGNDDRKGYADDFPQQPDLASENSQIKQVFHFNSPLRI